MILEILYKYYYYCYSENHGYPIYKHCNISINGEDIYSYSDYGVEIGKKSLKNYLIPEDPIIYLIPKETKDIDVENYYKNIPTIIDILYSISAKFHINSINVVDINKLLIQVDVSEITEDLFQKQDFMVLNVSQVQTQNHIILSNEFRLLLSNFYHLFPNKIDKPLERSVIVEIICKPKPKPKLELKFNIKPIDVTKAIIQDKYAEDIVIVKKNITYIYKSK